MTALPGSHGWAVTTAERPAAHLPRRAWSPTATTAHRTSPTSPGSSPAQTLHAHDYRDPAIFTDKDVVVVGVGNSGMDIACDAAKVAHRVYLVTRHGVHVIPKYAFGRPVDQLGNPLMGYIPFPVERTLYETIMRLSTGRPEDRGLPKPDHRLLHAHPTVSAELYDRVGHGDITMKPGIERLDGDQIRFDDDSVVHADVLVLRHRVPDHASRSSHPRSTTPRTTRCRSTSGSSPPTGPGLFFIGFIQTVGANIPLYEYQSQWIGDVLTGDAALPSPDEMRDVDRQGPEVDGRALPALGPAHDAGRLLALHPRHEGGSGAQAAAVAGGPADPAPGRACGRRAGGPGT